MWFLHHPTLPKAFHKLLVLACLGLPVFSHAQTPAYFDAYDLKPASATLDIGVQPLAFPDGVVAALLRRDQILHQALQKAGHPLRSHAFKRGGDMLPLLADQRLQAGTLGNMPTIIGASGGGLWIVGLVEQSATVIVANANTSIKGLAGKRIGYVEASTAHHTLLQGLASAGMKETDLSLVSMSIDELAPALAAGTIDAFSGWEPAISTALKENKRNRAVFGGQSASYLIISKAFAQRSPEAARHLVAALLRCVEWMRRSRDHLNQAVRWALADAQAFSGQPLTLSVGEVAAITRQNLLNIPSAPVVVHSANKPTLQGEYQLLLRLKKIPPTTAWATLQSAFDFDGLQHILTHPDEYPLNRFDYSGP